MSILSNNIIAQILDMTPQGVGKWKKENRPIINLLEKYFTKEELEEFLMSGKISKFEFQNELNSNLLSFSIEIQKKLQNRLKNFDDNSASWDDFDTYISTFVAQAKDVNIKQLQLELLKKIEKDNKLNPSHKIAYLVAIGSLSKIEFYIFVKEWCLL